MLTCPKCKARMISLPLPAAMDEPDVCVRVRKCRTCGFKAWTEERFIVRHKPVSLKQQAKDDSEYQDYLRRAEIAFNYVNSGMPVKYHSRPLSYEAWQNPEHREESERFIAKLTGEIEGRQKLLDDPDYLTMKQQMDPSWTPDE